MSLTWLLKHGRQGKASGLIFFSLLFPAMAWAQQVRVEGGFLSDSIKIGEQTAYYLSAHYPSNASILFPDSAYDFAPFEYQKKAYFQTNTTNGISADSAVYYLTTFEVGRVQFLDLPVYVVQPKDCTRILTRRDSVLITQFVQHVPDSVSADKLPLKMNTAYQKVFFNFNFWVVIIAVVVLLALSIFIWVVFGKRIKRYFKARKLQKNHAQFLETYNSILAPLQNAFSAFKTESALSLWKKYMEQLESRPYTKLTTRETFKLLKEPRLSDHLTQIDRAIYGHNTTVLPSLENLKSYADQQFSRKLKEVKHG